MLYSETDAYRMCVVAEVLFDGRGSHTRNINIPAIDGVPARRIHGKSLLIRLSIYNLHFCKTYPLFVAGCGGNTRDHHEFDQFMRLQG
jgi:hypothetical protein